MLSNFEGFTGTNRRVDAEKPDMSGAEKLTLKFLPSLGLSVNSTKDKPAARYEHSYMLSSQGLM